MTFNYSKHKRKSSRARYFLDGDQLKLVEGEKLKLPEPLRDRFINCVSANLQNKGQSQIPDALLRRVIEKAKAEVTHG